MAPFLLSHLPTCQSLFHACASQAALFPHLFQVYEAESLDSFPLGHCSPYLKIKKTLLKRFHLWEPQFLVAFLLCMCKFLNKYCREGLCACGYSVSLLEEAPPRFSAFQGQFPHFLCFKKFCMGHTQGPGPSAGSQKGDLSPLVSRVVMGGNCGDLHLLESQNIGTRSTFYALQIGKPRPSLPPSL